MEPDGAPIKRVLRTPASAFAGVEAAGWRWGEPAYFTSTLFGAEVRIAYWDLAGSGEGSAPSGETVLLTHGEPSWSFLNRRLIGPLLAKGHRVVLFDQVGFGWSDKPAAKSDYSYARHVAWNEDLLWKHLGLKNVTAVFQDWGGLLGLRLAARAPERFARLVLSNTALPTCTEGEVGQGFFDWKQFVFKGGLDGPGKVGQLIGRAARGPSCGPDGKLSKAEEAAYEAPFPDISFKAGAQAFPELVPTPPGDPTGRPQPLGGEANRAAWEVFAKWRKPVLLAFSDSDPVLGNGDAVWKERCPGCASRTAAGGPLPHVTLRSTGHFSQDGGGNQLAEVLVQFIAATPGASAVGASSRL